MALRCLLFSSHEELVEPIWKVLADLGIEGEYCPNAVDAVERVTTQLFQIVIADWENQPEAGFLLKTARDLKAAQRPLTLAIVGESSKLPEALQAGANSVLVKPIRAEQVRDTMGTACELLRAKQKPHATQAAIPSPAQANPGQTGAAAAVARAMTSKPATMGQSPESAFRAGEFLQTPPTNPGSQFDTEPEVAVPVEGVATESVDALSDLEPTAAAVVDDSPAISEAASEPEEPLTGWAALQARLTKSAPAPPPAEPAPGNELLSYGDTPSYGADAAASGGQVKQPAQPEPQVEEGIDAPEVAPVELVEPSGSKRNRLVGLGFAAALLVTLAIVPRTRHVMEGLPHGAVNAVKNWLNPPPPPLQQAPVQHDSFAQAGDEYKMPAAENIPDATTDPSQIRVVPVIDPTAKTDKTTEGAGTQATPDSSAPTQTQAAAEPGTVDKTVSSAPGQGGTPPNDAATASSSETSAPGTVIPQNAPASVNAPQATPVAPPAPQPRPIHAAVPSPPRTVATSNPAGIPSSLRSQLASSNPEASGAKPVEAAMSSIEPVKLPEQAIRDLLAQAPEPEYPTAAKASGQRGSVVLEVLIGRDGTVQDAKFLQGSFLFARSAIDAVRQWHFKPYTMNGRPVSVQSMLTLNFAPAASR